MKNLRYILFLPLFTLLTFCILNIGSRSLSFEWLQGTKQKYVPPDELPELIIENSELNNSGLLVGVKIKVKGQTPILITPRRLNVRINKINSKQRGYKTKYFQSEDFRVIQPGDDFDTSISVTDIKWYDGDDWIDTTMDKLEKGEYEYYISYGGTKDGLLLGNYDFSNLLTSPKQKFTVK